MPNSTSPRTRDLRRHLGVASVLAAMGGAVLDASSMNLALPSISGSLHVEPSHAAWLMIAYQAALMASLLPLAAIGERYGNRRAFVSGVCLFAACAVGCMLASNFNILIILRMLQGVGASAVMSLGVALLRLSVPPHQLGKVIGWNAMMVALMSAAGPTIGAALLSAGSWRFVFAGGIFLAITSLGAAFALPANSAGRRALDVRGMVSYVAIVFTFVIAVGLALLSPRLSIGLLLCGVIGFWLFARRDRGLTSPFLPLDVLCNPTFIRSALASVACFTGLGIALMMLPFALHMRLGSDPLLIAMLMTPWPLAVLLTTPIATSALARFAAATLCATGGFCMTIGLVTLAMTLTPSVELHLFAIMLCGVGFGLFQTPNNRSMFQATPEERTASAGGLQATARLTGQVGGALIASLLLSNLTVLTASRYAFGLAAMATFIAGLISLQRLKN